MVRSVSSLGSASISQSPSGHSTAFNTGGTNTPDRRMSTPSVTSQHSQHSFQPIDSSSSLSWNPDTNALVSSFDSLPQPYRMIQEILQENILEQFWTNMEIRQLQRGIVKVPMVIDGTDPPPVPSLARVAYAKQGRITAEELPNITPTRIVAPIFPPSQYAQQRTQAQPISPTAKDSSAPAASSGSSASPLPTSITATCACSSLDGRVGLIGSSEGLVYLLDLARGYSVIGSIGGGGGGDATVSNGRVTAVAVSPTPILRGDEDHLNGDEVDTLYNYTLIWSFDTGVTRVVTLNREMWSLTEGCTFSTTNLSSSTSTTTTTMPILGLQFSHDASHVAITLQDATVQVYQLRPHRYDRSLEAPKLTQKEILGNPKLAAAAATNANVNGSSMLGVGVGGGVKDLGTVSASDLTSFLSDTEFASHGQTFCELRSVLNVQAKLYTPVLVLTVRPPKTLLKEATQNQQQGKKEQGNTIMTSATPSAASSPTPSQSQSASPKPNAANRRASIKAEKQAAAAAATAAANATAAVGASAGVSDVPSASSSVAGPLTCPAIPTRVFFHHARRDRSLGSPPSYVTRGVIVVWSGDTTVRRWDLKETMPVLPGINNTAIATVNTPNANTSGGGSSTLPPTIAEKNTIGSPSSTKRKSLQVGKSDAVGSSSGGVAGVDATNSSAASGNTNSNLFLLPPTTSFLLFSPLSSAAVDVSTTLMAIGLRNGSTALFHVVLGTTLGVLNPMPTRAHAATTPSPSPSSSPSTLPPTSVTSLAFYHASHLLVGCQDGSTQTFFLPDTILHTFPTSAATTPTAPATLTNPTQLVAATASPSTSTSTSISSTPLHHIRTRITPPMFGPIVSIVIGTKIPLAIITVKRTTERRDDPSDSNDGGDGDDGGVDMFLYDFVSSYFLGHLLSSASSSVPSSSPLSVEDVSDEFGRLSLPQPGSLASTAQFQVHHHGATGVGGGGRTGKFHVEHTNEEKEVERKITTGSAPFSLPIKHLQPSASGSLAIDSSRIGGVGGTRMNMDHFNFHRLTRQQGPFATIDTEQVLILAAPSVASTNGTTGGDGVGACVLVYSLADLIASVYPSVASCPNGFLRQQHAIDMYRHYPDHTARRGKRAFQDYLDLLDAKVAESNQQAIHQAFHHRRQSSNPYGASARRSAGGGHSRGHSRSGSNMPVGHRKQDSRGSTGGGFRMSLAQIASEGSKYGTETNSRGK